MTGPELVEEGILPEISGFYNWDHSSDKVDALTWIIMDLLITWTERYCLFRERSKKVNRYYS